MAQGVSILRRHTCNPALYQLAEGLYLRHRALAHIHREEHGLFDHLPETHAIGLRRLYNLAHRRITDTSRGIVHYAFESFLIIRIRNQAEIGNHILNLLALVEAQSTIDAIRYIVLAHLLLKASALRIRAIQYGKVTPVAILLSSKSFDVLRHDHRLLPI